MATIQAVLQDLGPSIADPEGILKNHKFITITTRGTEIDTCVSLQSLCNHISFIRWAKTTPVMWPEGTHPEIIATFEDAVSRIKE